MNPICHLAVVDSALHSATDVLDALGCDGTVLCKQPSAWRAAVKGFKAEEP